MYRRDHGYPDGAALGQQQSEELFGFGADLAITDIRRQGSDFVDDQHNQRLVDRGVVQPGVAAQSLRSRCCMISVAARRSATVSWPLS